MKTELYFFDNGNRVSFLIMIFPNGRVIQFENVHEDPYRITPLEGKWRVPEWHKERRYYQKDQQRNSYVNMIRYYLKTWGWIAPDFVSYLD